MMVDPVRFGADILTASQMRAAEQQMFDAGISVAALMERAGRGAADYVWRVAGPERTVSVLVGPGNNGGDGWVIARALLERGGRVQVVMAAPPVSDAARAMCQAYEGAVCDGADWQTMRGEVLVDCLFGTGLSRALSPAHLAMLQGLAAQHRYRIAVDLPSGVESDCGDDFGQSLPDYQMTIALGAWKRSHGLMPAVARMGDLRLVDIGCAPAVGAGRMVEGIHIAPPAAGAHKYTRGLVGMVVGDMPGAAQMAARAAAGTGAGYVQMLSDQALAVPPDLVVKPLAAWDRPDKGVTLIGPGLGRGDAARSRLADGLALCGAHPHVVDGDGLSMLTPRMTEGGPMIATPHEGELARLERAFALEGTGSKVERALALARHLGAVVAKGPDTVIASRDGRWAMVPRASAWLSVAGSGDVLAGIIAGRLATMPKDPFAAACQGVWLHGRAAGLLKGPFTAMALADAVPRAVQACL
ncbi:MAG: NAD(P)H-hydrate epimerase [Sphingomonadales bacterium]|nr:NAD(P)H-hydrate epimerase [Sphingomonadales bacterium]MDE2169517.1 NAD(P)H-hydrate epimerase [Sphingomonadales bacterium]